MKLQKESGKNIVRLHNNFVEAVYSLSLEAKKILLSVILHLNDSNKIEIHRTDLMKEVGVDPRKVKNLKEVIKELMTKIIEIRDLDNSGNWSLYQLLMATEYENGVLKTSVYPELLPYFKEAQERLFTRFNIQNIRPLTSVHAVRIYELVKQFDDTGWREIDLDEFKKMLHLESKYDRIFDLKRRVLEVAKKQINTNTDINIDYELIKQGRKYIKIRFIINKNRRRVERKENRKLIENGKFVELEEELNKNRGKIVIKDEGGRSWYVEKVKVLNEKEAELHITNLSEKKIIKRKISELSGMI